MTDREAVLYRQLLEESGRLCPAFRTGNPQQPVDAFRSAGKGEGKLSETSTLYFALGKNFARKQTISRSRYALGWGKSILARRNVFNRDAAVCKLCGLDTKALEFALNYVRMKIQEHAPSFECTFFDFKRAVGVNASRFPERSWDIDHIIPRSEDGSDDLSNLRTLCLSCHRKETNKLMARRAKQRKHKFRSKKLARDGRTSESAPGSV